MKLRTKIIVLVITLSLIINILFLGFFVYNNKKESLARLYNKIENTSILLNQVNSGPLYDGDVLKLGTNLKSFLKDPEIASINLDEFHGNINITFENSRLNSEDLLEEATAVTYNDEEIGTITTLYSTQLINDRFYDSISLLIVSYILMTLVLSISLFFLLKKLTKPISDLTELSTEIANGNLEKDIQVLSQDEIGILSQSLIIMRDSIKSTIHSLKLENEEREIAEKELKVAKSYIDNIINSMPSLLIGVDSQHRVTQWNKQAEKLCGISSNEAKGKDIHALFPYLNEDHDKISDAIASKQVLHENRCETEDGKTIRYQDITIFPLISNGTDGAVIQIDDVTKQHEMLSELAHSRKLDAIGQLAGGVAHDFNNMLAGILGGAELLGVLLEGNEKAHNYLKMILQSAQRAGDLTNKLLTFARKGKVESTPVSVTVAINEAVAILEHSLDKRIKITVSLQTDSTWVVGDLAQLQNALINLGVNAGHAMPAGGNLDFNVDLVDLDEVYCKVSSFDIEAGKYLHIEVCDTGVGIPSGNLHKIFEPFYTTKKEGMGSGLGLAAVYGTVQQHNGAITVYSKEGTGTTFHIFLPLAEQQVTSISVSGELPIVGSGKILVIDDEKVIQATASSILENLGYDVMLADDGQHGLEIFKQEFASIDLVVMDMIMPKMNGQECFFAMKKICPDVKVILASGFSRDADIEELRKYGLRGFLRKPYTTTDLSKAIVAAREDDGTR